jgi:hypothetical protein
VSCDRIPKINKKQPYIPMHNKKCSKRHTLEPGDGGVRAQRLGDEASVVVSESLSRKAAGYV